MYFYFVLFYFGFWVLQLVIEDLCELWSLFQEKLEIFLQQRFAEGGFSTSEVGQSFCFVRGFGCGAFAGVLPDRTVG